jgi:hypothetical protein
VAIRGCWLDMRFLLSLDEQARRLDERKWTLGITREQLAACRNRGRRRTPEKRALLKAIEERAAARGRQPAFVAYY